MRPLGDSERTSRGPNRFPYLIYCSLTPAMAQRLAAYASAHDMPRAAVLRQCVADLPVPEADTAVVPVVAADSQDLVSIWLEVRRHARGWSLKELARRSGIPKSTLGDIEHGHTELRVGQLVRLAEALACPPSDLVTFHRWTEAYVPCRGGTL